MIAVPAHAIEIYDQLLQGARKLEQVWWPIVRFKFVAPYRPFGSFDYAARASQEDGEFVG